tara:strand:- start:366 stop:602 length:237 start_codon:yes stop_codon:yes gene_type:complete
MAWLKYAIVELDPPESNSTGGMVIELTHMLDTDTRETAPMSQHWLKKVDEYKMIQISEDSPVQVGWIYTDKTHQFVAP